MAYTFCIDHLLAEGVHLCPSLFIFLAHHSVGLTPSHAPLSYHPCAGPALSLWLVNGYVCFGPVWGHCLLNSATVDFTIEFSCAVSQPLFQLRVPADCVECFAASPLGIYFWHCAGHFGPDRTFITLWLPKIKVVWWANAHKCHIFEPQGFLWVANASTFS